MNRQEAEDLLNHFSKHLILNEMPLEDGDINEYLDEFVPEYKAENLPISGVSERKFFSVEGGGDWADASVDYFINLTDRTGEEVHKEYEESGGYHGNGKKWFREWAVKKGYMREPTDSELETYYDGL